MKRPETSLERFMFACRRDPAATVEFTDWNKVAEFAGRIQTM